MAGYIGKIKNAGVQKVSAPVSQGKKAGKSTVKKGDDLRNGSK